MHTVHKKVQATVSSIQEVGKDSKEIFFTFNDPIEFNYFPGQFIMLEIPEPKEDDNWKIVTPRDVWDMIQKEGELSLDSLTALFPDVEEKTLGGMVHKLSSAGYLHVSETGIYSVNPEQEPEKKRPPFQRAYSMASCPNNSQTISTMVKTAENGFMSKYLVERLSVGEQVSISGPLGKFTYESNDIENILISAGSGITPLMSILRYIDTTKHTTKSTLLYSNKIPENIIYRAELEELEENNNGISVLHTITRPEDSKEDWTGLTGRIDLDLIKKTVASHASGNTQAFICGPMVFGKSMKELLIEAGMPTESIHMEAYG